MTINFLIRRNLIILSSAYDLMSYVFSVGLNPTKSKQEKYYLNKCKTEQFKNHKIHSLNQFSD